MITENQHLPNLSKILNIPDLYFKREDKHPLSSHKGRSIPIMIDHYKNMGIKKFVISSSGNSALASALWIKKINYDEFLNLKLQIFIGEKIPLKKENSLRVLADENIKINKVKKPKQKMIELGRSDYQTLRQSKDDIALVGYKKVAEEILEIYNLKFVFFPVSSGTLMQGVAENLPNDIKIFAVQTEKCHPIAENFDKHFTKLVKQNSIADAIVDKVSFRKIKIIEMIKNRSGGGFVVSNNLIDEALTIFKDETGEILSPNGILAFSGLLKFLKKDFKPNKQAEITGAVACIVGGQ